MARLSKMYNGCEAKSSPAMDNNVWLQKRCLTMISRIATRASYSFDPQRLRDTLMELGDALQNPIDGQELQICQQLDFIDSTSGSQKMHEMIIEMLQFDLRTNWN